MTDTDTESAEMETRLSLFLFGKPAWEIEELESSELTFKIIDEIHALGKELHERLEWAARIARTLLNHGWDAEGGLYDITFYKDVSEELARNELKDLGLNPDELSIEEEEIED